MELASYPGMRNDTASSDEPEPNTSSSNSFDYKQLRTFAFNEIKHHRL